MVGADVVWYWKWRWPLCRLLHWPSCWYRAPNKFGKINGNGQINGRTDGRTALIKKRPEKVKNSFDSRLFAEKTWEWNESFLSIVSFRFEGSEIWLWVLGHQWIKIESERGPVWMVANDWQSSWKSEIKIDSRETEEFHCLEKFIYHFHLWIVRFRLN